MSRLGDLIKAERVQRGLSPKQVAKLGGVSEKFLLEVERGDRIIADNLASRILKKLGTSDEALMPFESTVLPEPTAEQVRQVHKPSKPIAQAGSEEVQPSQAWLDALGGVVKQVPIYGAGMRLLGNRLTATEKGKIEGFPADKVFYVRLEDESLSGFGLMEGDMLLMAPSVGPVDGRIQLVVQATVPALHWVSALDGNRVLLQQYDKVLSNQMVETRSVIFRAQAIRAERRL